MQSLLTSLKDTVESPEQLTVVIFDNGSDHPYSGYFDFTWPFKVITVRSEKNRGYYRPLTDLSLEATSADIVGLCHNDLIFYEKGWDRRLRECFVREGRLGMVGFCGSNEVDDRGGRGGGTMCNFRGEKGALQEHTGRRITDLQPALIFDSLFLAMRQQVVGCLRIDDDIALNHFGDRVWPLRAIENEWRVGVLGIEIDHRSGQTVVGLPRIEQDSRLWCNEHDIPIPEGMQAGTAVYLEAERRYLSEYREVKHLIPARMQGWQIVPTRTRP
jgi:hypothetical protein